MDGLRAVAHELALGVIRGGEGANTLIEITVTGAATDADAWLAAKAIANSPLVKTAVHGGDPNWGRLVAAAGRSGAAFVLGGAHFQIGSAIDLFRGSSFSADAYEQLPIGDQKIYQSIRNGKIVVTVVAGSNVNEDNGFINSLDIPLDRHTTLSGYYSRSLRLHTDTAAASITYTFRAPAPDTLESNVSALFR